MKELTIHHVPAKARRRARVRVSYRAESGMQPQERETEFRFAISGEERRLLRWYLEEYLIYPWGEFRTRAQEAEELMQRLGGALFEAVFRSRETLALYAHVADDLSNTRIVIHAAGPEGIALPWELLRDPARGEYGDLARLAYTFVRSQPDLIFTPPQSNDAATFNILMVICRPGGPDSDVPFQSVARPLLELFRPHRDRIRLDVLRPPTFEQLSHVLSDRPRFYHVLHFDGHGAFPEAGDSIRFYSQMGAQGRLLFETDQGGQREVTGEELGGLLARSGVPIVLLNACQSGMTYPEALYPSIGNQLLKAGTHGVVAMAYSVYVQTAVQFMARLYEGLMNGEELARAVALAREGLRAHPQRLSPIGEVSLRDWVVPVLFEAAPIRPVAKPLHELRLDPSLLQDRQAAAGVEVDCPEPPVHGFFGRDGVILELQRACERETVVLLDGMAGVGKTETALGFARWRAETGALDGPIFFFSFERYLPLARVCDRVGQVFSTDIREQLGADWHLLDAGQRRKVALTILKQVPCLMIWDNVEPIAGFPAGTRSAWTLDEQAELRDFLRDLRGGKTKVLLTSRRDEPWLGGIYRRVELGGLHLVESQELAIHVLQRAGLSSEQIRSLPEYNDLLNSLRGNPLAIQVILPELKRMSPDALLQALQAGAVKLGADDPALGRGHSLTASLTYRLDTLEESLRRRLGLLGLFQGFVAAEVLAAMCLPVKGMPELIRGLGRDEWIRILNTVTELGLLRHVGEGYYSVHPAVPWLFHDLLSEACADEREWLELAFSRAYHAAGRTLYQLFQTKAPRAMFLLRIEEDNLMHALRLARRHARWDDVEGILYGLSQSLTTQGRWVEWERLISDIEAEVTDTEGEPLSGRGGLWLALLGHLAGLAEHHGDLEAREAIVHHLTEYYASKGDRRNHAVSLHQLGMIALQQGRLEEAERWYEQSLAIGEEIGNEPLQAASLHQLGEVAEQREQLEEAEGLYQRSLAISERIGDRRERAAAFHQLGIIAQKRERLEEAEQWYRKSLAVAENVGDASGQANTLHQLGRVAQEHRRFEEAERWFQLSLAIDERIGGDRDRASNLHSLGLVAQQRGQLDEAEWWYRQSLSIDERIADERGHAATLYQLGRVAEERGDVATAAQLYERAEALLVPQNDPHVLQMIRESLQRVRLGSVRRFVENGQWQDAERVLSEQILRCKEKSDLTGAVALFRERARARVQMRAYEQARWDFKKVITLCEELGDVTTLADVEVELAELEYRNGLLNDAVHHLERAAEHLPAGENGDRIANIRQLQEEIQAHAVLRSAKAPA